MKENKLCSRCKIVLPIENFYIVKRKTKKGWSYTADCKSCQAEYARQWKNDNPDKHKTNTKKATLKARYGLSIEEFNTMLINQNNLCSICSIDISDKPYVDHDHATGKVRELLCFKCNTGLGSFQDSPEILQKALEYLLTNK